MCSYQKYRLQIEVCHSDSIIKAQLVSHLIKCKGYNETDFPICDSTSFQNEDYSDIVFAQANQINQYLKDSDYTENPKKKVIIGILTLKDLDQLTSLYTAGLTDYILYPFNFLEIESKFLLYKDLVQKVPKIDSKLNDQLKTLEYQKVLLDALPVTIYSKNIDLEFQYTNISYTSHHGYLPEDFLGKREESLFPLEQSYKNDKKDREVLNSGMPVISTEKTPSFVSGNEHWELVMRVPYRNQNGQIDGLVVTGIDITERKKTEVALEKAKIAAEKANETKTNFIAKISHELRTPMNGILNMADLLTSTFLDKQQWDFLKIIKQSSDHLLTLINDLLDFSKLDTGNLSLNPIDFDLRAALYMVDQLNREKADSKQIDFKLTVSPNAPSMINGDPARIRQIMINLISNAIKFTQKGEVELEVTVISEEDQGINLMFTCRDTGIGIDQENINRIFNSFSQADDSINRRFGGTGLGLAITKQLCQMMNGDITVQSEVEKGTVFKATVWVGKARNPETDKSIKTILEGLKILLVDPNDISGQAVQYLLQHKKNQVDHVNTGAVCLDIIKEAILEGDPYHLLICDKNLPDMSAVSLAKKIRSCDEELVMVMTTNNGRRGDAKEAQDAGFSAYLAKPYDTEYFIKTLMAAYGRTGNDTINIITKYSLVEEQRRQARILVAEDNPVNQMVVQQIIKRLGHQLEIAENGKEALNLLGNATPDLILLDLHMPVMDGLQTAEEIQKKKNLKEIPEIPIVLISADRIDITQPPWQDLGINDFLLKPFRIKELTTIIEKKLKFQLPPVVVKNQTVSDFNGDPDLFNIPLYLDRVEGDTQLACTLIEEFFKSGKNTYNSLREAITNRNMDQIGKIAHRLKGAAGTLCIQEIYLQAVYIEKSSKDNIKVDWDLAINILEDIWEATIEQLEAYLNYTLSTMEADDD